MDALTGSPAKDVAGTTLAIRFATWVLVEVAEVVESLEPAGQQALGARVRVGKATEDEVIAVLHCPLGLGFGFLRETKQTILDLQDHHVILLRAALSMEELVVNA